MHFNDTPILIVKGLPISPFSMIIAALNSKYSVQKWWDYMLQPLLPMVTFRNSTYKTKMHLAFVQEKSHWIRLQLAFLYVFSWVYSVYSFDGLICANSTGKKLKAFSRLTVEIHEVVRILFNHITKTFWLFEWPKKVQESWATTN